MDFFSHPAVQSSIIPFCGSLFVLFLAYFFPRANGLAVVLGLLAGVYLMIGFELQPLTSTKKLILTMLMLYVVGEILTSLEGRFKQHYQTVLLVVLVLCSYLWIAWPVLVSGEMADVAISLSIALVFLVTTIGSIFWRSHSALTYGVGGVMFALTSGGCIVLAGSALYGQILFALGASLGAVVLWTLIRPTEYYLNFAVPSFALITTGNLAATHYAQMNLWLLIPLALTLLPLLFFPNRSYTHWKSLLFVVLLCLPGAVASLAVAWYISGPPPI